MTLAWNDQTKRLVVGFTDPEWAIVTEATTQAQMPTLLAGFLQSSQQRQIEEERETVKDFLAAAPTNQRRAVIDKMKEVRQQKG
jgi:hypothetical protein